MRSQTKPVPKVRRSQLRCLGLPFFELQPVIFEKRNSRLFESLLDRSANDLQEHRVWLFGTEPTLEATLFSDALDDVFSLGPIERACMSGVIHKLTFTIKSLLAPSYTLSDFQILTGF